MKKEFKGTKGKWIINKGIRKGEVYFYSIFSGVEKICEIQEEQVTRNLEKTSHNAQLIAHAPEMFDMLQMHIYALDNGSIKFFERYGFNVSELSGKVRDILTRATTI